LESPKEGGHGIRVREGEKGCLAAVIAVTNFR